MKARNYFIILIVLSTVIFAVGCSKKVKSAVECDMTEGKNMTTANCDMTNAPKVFTLDELSKFDGQNGRASYIAINSVVYDVTNYNKWREEQLFSNCKEKVAAGKDLSQYVINTNEAKQFLDSVPKVGGLKK
ncbi:hypothetical protein SDC9_76465 [bioreactor metagenome]|uniref:Cytochrome b5 heme-binding domain-containing protein n=1 Tax=bioreactor metagenome TaxID=1076179 RepID=A0A644YTX6_9ZZZZ